MTERTEKEGRDDPDTGDSEMEKLRSIDHPWALPGRKNQTAHTVPPEWPLPCPLGQLPLPGPEESTCLGHSPTSPARRHAGQTCGLSSKGRMNWHNEYRWCVQHQARFGRDGSGQADVNPNKTTGGASACRTQSVWGLRAGGAA